MTVLSLLAVGVAGGVGSALRYLTDNSLPRRLRDRFPWGTALINLVGSLIIGVISGLGSWFLPEFWVLTLGTGLVGGYTTFSTSSVETVRLLYSGKRGLAIINGLGMLILCVALAGGGFAFTVAMGA